MRVTYSEYVAAAAARLGAAGVENPAVDAWRLAEEAFSRLHGRCGLVPHEEIDRNAEVLLSDWLNQRECRRPVSQIIGRRHFHKGEFIVTSDVLDPRPESEILVDAGILRDPKHILDLGTGSGCLLLSLLAELPAARGVGIDLSHGALRIARENSRRMGLADRADFHRSDWFSKVVGRFDLIVANPPYLSESEYADSPGELAQWEPRLALTDGGDGLSPYRIIAAGAGRHLSPGGCLIFEIGAGSLDQVRDIAIQSALKVERVVPDFEGRPRAVCCTSGT